MYSIRIYTCTSACVQLPYSLVHTRRPTFVLVSLYSIYIYSDHSSLHHSTISSSDTQPITCTLSDFHTRRHLAVQEFSIQTTCLISIILHVCTVHVCTYNIHVRVHGLISFSSLPLFLNQPLFPMSVFLF